MEVQYLLKRALKTPFGDVPLPAGTWRLYDADAGGRLQLIGEARGEHTAAGQDVRLSAGSAFDLTAERIQTDYTTTRENNRTDRERGLSRDDQQRQGLRRDRRGVENRRGNGPWWRARSRERKLLRPKPASGFGSPQGQRSAHLSCPSGLVTDGPTERPTDPA